MTKLTLLNRDNKKMTGGGNVKQGLRPLATGFFGFRLWPKKNSSYKGVTFVGETPSPAGPFTTELTFEDNLFHFGYYQPESVGSLSHYYYKGVEITGIYATDGPKVFYLIFNGTAPPFTKITAAKVGEPPVSLQKINGSHPTVTSYEWDENLPPANNAMIDFFTGPTLANGDKVTITIE